jgi:hypothetical protein
MIMLVDEFLSIAGTSSLERGLFIVRMQGSVIVRLLGFVNWSVRKKVSVGKGGLSRLLLLYRVGGRV